MSQNFPRCEWFLSRIEFETETGNEKWIGNYTAVGVDTKKKIISLKIYASWHSLQGIKFSKHAFKDCSLRIVANTVKHKVKHNNCLFQC